MGRAAARQVWSAYDITKARFLEIKLYSNEQKTISLDRTVGELENIAGSKSNVLKRFPEQQAGAARVLHGETFHTNERGRHKEAEETAVSLSLKPGTDPEGRRLNTQFSPADFSLGASLPFGEGLRALSREGTGRTALANVPRSRATNVNGLFQDHAR